MAARTSPSEPVGQPAGIDEQLWPIVCATMVLVGILGVLVVVNSDFEEDRLFLNGYTHLAGLGVGAGLLIYIASRLKGAARRTAELAIVLSLAWHAAAGVGAFYLFQSDLGGLNARDARPESDDEPLPPDYHWAQDDQQQPEQAFEKAVSTTIREAATPAAQLQPRDMERLAPAAEIPHVPKVEVTPLGADAVAEPSEPLDIRRPDAAKREEAKPPEALAMVRQREDDLPIPKSESPAADHDHEYMVPAEAPKEPRRTPEPAAVQFDKSDWAGAAKQATAPARVEVQPDQSLPALLGNGPALPSAPARRAIASQTEDGASGAGANQAAKLPRTETEMGWGPAAAAKIAESPASAGTGGNASSGRPVSTLYIGQPIALQRGAGSDAPGQASRVASGVSDLLLGNDGKTEWHSVPGVAAAGPRRTDQGTPAGDDNGAGSVPRARSEIIVPQSGVGRGAWGEMGSTPHETRPTPNEPIGPSAGLAGLGRRETAGQGIGSHPSGPDEPLEIASAVGVASPQPSGVGGLAGGHHATMVGDAELDQVLSGGGMAGVSRRSSQIVVSGDVHGRMEAFRPGSSRSGLTIGDSAGGQLTEPAIENGLEYFEHTQFKDGHWSLHELPSGIVVDSADLGSLHADAAATGLALLAYLGAGYTHQDVKYRDVVRRGVEWLVKHQQPDGNLSYHGSDATHFYSQGIATMALCEAYGMTQDRELRAPAQKAVDFIVKSQDRSRGGWRYRPQDGSDTSVTGWQLMALKSAQMAGLEVPEETFRKVGRWLDLAQVPNRGTYVYNPWNTDSENPRGREPNPTMTAQAMVMRMYLGQDRDKASLALGANYLLAHLPEVGTRESPERDCYYWYYATQAMYHMQGDYWKTWDARIAPLLRAGQIDRGPLKGSWNPREPVPDQWGAFAGRHYVTSLQVLTLEFRYWHLPLFRELRKE